MAIKGRQTLYSIFINGAIPTQKDYRDLIDSALNRRDDHFFGQWQKGMKYCVGDVVIYNKALYKLIPNVTDDLCPPNTEEPTAESTEELDEGCYCSLVEPPFDEKNWCVLELDLKDKDWEIICEPEGDPEGTAVKIFQMTAKVGIGTDDPNALLDLTNQNKILIEPNADGSPDISLQKYKTLDSGSTEKEQYVRYRLTDEVCWETDAPAYVFKLEGEETANAIAKSAPASVSAGAPPILLMKVTSNSDKVPQVGIGTAAPKGGLHVKQDSRGHVVLNPANHQEPGVLIVNLEEDSTGYYSLSGVSNKYAFFATDSEGFVFKKLDVDHDGLMDCDSTSGGTDLVAILCDGRVGVGTIDPKSNVEITDGTSGSARIHIGKGMSNPVFSLSNLRPYTGQTNTYGAMGVDDNNLVLISDTPGGFVFKGGRPFKDNDNPVNINQGREVFFISPTGKTGIKTDNPPTDYDLDVRGHVRSLTAYLATSSKTIEKMSDLKEEDFLKRVCELQPIKYKWIDESFGTEEEIGFMAENVFEQFPGLIKKTGTNKNEKAIAYGNMTAVLVQAIKDQQKLIKDLDDRICDLEEKLK